MAFITSGLRSSLRAARVGTFLLTLLRWLCLCSCFDLFMEGFLGPMSHLFTGSTLLKIAYILSVEIVLFFIFRTVWKCWIFIDRTMAFGCSSWWLVSWLAGGYSRSNEGQPWESRDQLWCLAGALSGIRAAATTPFEQTKIDRQVYVLRKALKQDKLERQWHFVDAENLVPVQ